MMKDKKEMQMNENEDENCEEDINISIQMQKVENYSLFFKLSQKSVQRLVKGWDEGEGRLFSFHETIKEDKDKISKKVIHKHIPILCNISLSLYIYIQRERENIYTYIILYTLFVKMIRTLLLQKVVLLKISSSFPSSCSFPLHHSCFYCLFDLSKPS